MKQSEEHLRDLAAAYAQPVFRNFPLKDDTLTLAAEACAKLPMFANTVDMKPLQNPEVPMNALSREQLAIGLALSDQTGAEKWD